MGIEEDFEKLGDSDKFVDPRKRAKSLKELKVKLEFQPASTELQIGTGRQKTNYTRYALWAVVCVAIGTFITLISTCSGN